MKPFQFCLILASIWLAPNVSPRVRLYIGAFYTGCTLTYFALDVFK